MSDAAPRGVWRYPVGLRRVEHSDLDAMFEMQSDPVANEMAGTKARKREAFFSAWEKNFADPGVNARVIVIGPEGARGDEARGSGEFAGVISRFQAEGRDAVGYWIVRPHWGKGVASRALELFLKDEARRPLHATTAKNNAASRHILEKCGFRCVGYRFGEETERYLAREIAEFVLE